MDIEVDVKDIKLEYFEDVKSEINVSFTCDRCTEVFNDFDQFQKHEHVDYACVQCKQSFSNDDELEKHQKTHIIPEQFKCDLCEKVYKKKNILTRHIDNVHIGKLELHRCNICGKKLSDASSLKRHTLTHTHREKTYFCDLCTNGYYRLRDLMVHKEKHAGVEYNCTLCTKVCIGTWSLKSHMKNVHSGTQVCDTCGKKFTSKDGLAEHIRIHTREKPFKCSMCDKSYRQKGALGIHIRCVHKDEKPYVCTICGKSFALNRLLKRHESIHIITSEQHICVVCNKSFGTNRGLCEHAQRHLPKKYKCLICSKEFRVPHILKKHMLTHTGKKERPFMCDICPKRYNQKSNLRNHRKLHFIN